VEGMGVEGMGVRYTGIHVTLRASKGFFWGIVRFIKTTTSSSNFLGGYS